MRKILCFLFGRHKWKMSPLSDNPHVWLGRCRYCGTTEIPWETIKAISEAWKELHND